MGGMRHRLAFEILQIRVDLLTIHTIGKLIHDEFHPTLPSSSPLDPDSSLDLHNRANVNRVEIHGFAKESIDDYFKETLSTQLTYDAEKNGCKEIRDR